MPYSRRRHHLRRQDRHGIQLTALVAIGIGCCYCCCCKSSLYTCEIQALVLSSPSILMIPTPLDLLTRTTTARRDNHFVLFMVPQSPLPPPRQPRRMLKKRRPKRGDRKRRREVISSSSSTSTSSPFGNIIPGIIYNNEYNLEYRPLVPSVRRDMGEDYWIDPIDFEREREQQQQRLKEKKKRQHGISDEKLWMEVKAPYRQNWIGYFSVMIAILSIIVSQFPELLEPISTIRYPDL